MENFFTIIALISAGVSLVSGLISLFIGLNKDGEKADLVFGIMGLCMFVHFLVPPVGFILSDHAPYPLILVVKRIFNFSFVAMFPWFTMYYTNAKQSRIPILISVMVAITFLVMAVSTPENSRVWPFLMILNLTVNLAYSVHTGKQMYTAGSRQGAKWFLSAIGIYFLLLACTFINQSFHNVFGRMLGTQYFFPMNLMPLAFIAIMSIRLRANTAEKYRLEKLLHRQEIQWNTLMKSMHLLVLELDLEGNIRYINPYGVKKLGYPSAAALLQKNWFDTCLIPESSNAYKALFREVIDKEQMAPHISNLVITKEGKKSRVNWTSVFVYDEHAKLKGTMSIGLDLTDQDKAHEEVQFLKMELEKEYLSSLPEHQTEINIPDIIGKSEAIKYAVQKVLQVSPTNAGVLLEGETGVGKELFADLIHRNSFRKALPLIKVNCASLPPELIESELFGHEKGAFTGALQSRKGRFELANAGTIFLDEIGELPLSLQPKLLRVLQNGTFERVGGQQVIKVDVRVIAATNRNLLKEVKAGNFREDLFYRLNVFPVTIPPLRNRKEDIPQLVSFYVNNFSGQHQKKFETISKADMQRLIDYSWPGNIRELINLIERSVISSQGNTLRLDWQNNSVEAHGDGVQESSIEAVERAYILKVLHDCNWKINGENGAAERLQLHPNTLRSRLKKLNIKRTY